MLRNPYFYFQIIKKYVVLFGSTFNDIHVERIETDDPTNKTYLKIPISYAPKDKMLTRVDSDPELNRNYSVILPRIAFELTGMQYDGSRKQPTTNYIKYTDPTNPEAVNKQYVPVPYNFKFSLYIGVKNVEDGTKIIEQILPFFTPNYTSSVELISDTNITYDIPIIFDGNIVYEDKYDGEFDNRRIILYTLTFTLKGYLFGPISKPKQIKFVQTNFYIPEVDDDELHLVSNTEPVAERLNVQVALTANGQPTTDHTQSIDYQLINIDDDYGFATWIELFEANN